MARTVSVKLMMDVGDYIRGANQAKGSTQGFTGELQKAAKAGHLDAVASQAAGMGLALVGAFGAVVGAAARFDKQMSAVSSVTNANAQSMEQLRAAAIQAGKDTAFSATEAAKAEEELAKAGISTSDILGGALKGSLALAAAGQLDLADAADISAKAMNIFNLSGKDVPHIADVLAASANKSATDVHEMGDALKMGGLAAHNAGMSFEDTAGVLSAFADNALNGSDAGTSLKQMLMMLQAPSGKAADLMKKLGLDVYDASGNFIGAAKFAQLLQDKLGGLTQEQRNAALTTIFGADATRSATVMMRLGAKGVQEYVAAVNDSGAANATAAKKMDNLAGDVERLKGSLETLAIGAGTGANSGLRKLVQTADALTSAISAIPAPMQTGLTILAGFGGASLLAVAGLIKVKGAATRAAEELRAMGPAGEKAAAGLVKAGKAAGVATLLFIGMEVFAAISDQLNDAAVHSDQLSRALDELGRSGKRSGEVARSFGKDFETSQRRAAMASDDFVSKSFRLYESLPIIGGLFRSVGNSIVGINFTQAKDNFKQLDDQLAQFAATTTDVSTAQSAYTKLLQQSGMSAEDFAKLMPKSVAALQDAWKATDLNARAAEDAAAKNKLLSHSFEDAATSGQTLADMFTTLNGKAEDFARAEISVEAAVDNLTKAFKDNGKTLDVHTDKGRANKTAVLDLVDAAVKAADAKLKETNSTAAATQTYNAYIDQLRKTMHQAGFTKSQIEALIGQYARMPASITTDVKANTADAWWKIEGLKKQVRSLTGKTITITTQFTSKGEHVPGGTQVKNERGGVYEHAASGLLREAATYTPQGPARYAFAEPATGGEAFIPKHGDMARSRSIWGYVGENWLGMQRAPQYVAAGGGGARPVVNVTVVAHASDGPALAREIVKLVRYEVIHEGGGSVQRAFGQ